MLLMMMSASLQALECLVVDRVPGNAAGLVEPADRRGVVAQGKETLFGVGGILAHDPDVDNHLQELNVVIKHIETI